MWSYIFCLVLLVGVGVLANKEETAGGVTTKVLGQSGKIRVYKQGGNETDGVTITMDAIKEVTSDNSAIQKHTFNTFASQDFTFSATEQTQYPDSDVNVTQFSFTSNVAVGSGQSIDGTAIVTSYVYIFSSDGNITVDGENFTVEAGMMKFNVKIEDWPFCEATGVTCKQGNTDQIGAWLDFYIEIKGQGSASASSDGKTYELGNGAKVVIPVKVTYMDNNNQTTTEDMPSGYPKLEPQGSKQTFVFRFRTFQKSALYDPTVDLGNQQPEPTTANQTMEQSGLKVDVLGKSGKMSLSNTKGNSITIEFDNLKEKKADGGDVKDNKHSLSTFANQDFQFSGPTDEDYPGSEFGTKKLVFNSSINNGAKLTVDMYIFKEDGNITLDGETTMVKSGDLKFSVTVSGWTFCGGSVSCTQSEVGEFLDFDIVMKGKKNAEKKTSASGSPDSYDVGSGTVYLSKKVMINGAYSNMPTGYPMAITHGSKQVFRLRFEKFTTSVFYDPTASLSTDNNPSGSGTVTGSMAVILTTALLAVLKNMF